MAISGKFRSAPRRGTYRPGDNSRNWGEGADPRHGERPTDDYGTPPPVPILRHEPPEFIEDDIDPYPPGLNVVDADTETANYGGTKPPHLTMAQHVVPTLPWGVPDNARLRALSGRLHGLKGRVFPSRMATKVGRDFTTRNETRRDPSLPPPSSAQGGAVSGQALRALRGRNSLPVNNPGNPLVSFSGNYVRQGHEISRITNRRMGRRGLSHTKRIMHVNVAQTAVERPGVPGPYQSPFASSGRFNLGVTRPAQRREPRPWDEDVVTDYAADGADYEPGFVAEGF